VEDVVENSLKIILDRLYDARSTGYIANDPISFCHRFPDPPDREVAGLIASSFAYGNVKIIIRNLEAIFSAIGPHPRRFVERFNPDKGLRLFSGFRHRFNDGRDLCALLVAIRTMVEKAGSIGEYFLKAHDPAAADTSSSLTSFSAGVLALDYSSVFGTPAIPADSSFPFLFPSPASGSACKRLCMYLRWMARPADGIDLGLWHGVAPAQLVIPVDAHVLRIGRYLGLTSRRQADWKTAQEITGALRRLDPDDPVKYDFALAHLGISEGCGKASRIACLTCDVAVLCSGDDGKPAPARRGRA
jgi:uncharacterized protein (TIGR02757 family)